MDVQFYEVFDEEEQALRRYLPKGLDCAFTWQTIQEAGHKHPPARLISIRTQSRLPSSWTGDLEGILTRSQGFDHLVAYRQTTGASAICGYLAPYCSVAVAEQAILGMLTLLRRLKEQTKSFAAFQRDHLTGKECRSRKALVIGVGHIGGEIADLVAGLQMVVKGVDITPKKDTIEYVPLEEGIGWADVIFSAVPLTPETQGMLDYAALRPCCAGALLINISRGEVTPTQDMVRLLEEGCLGGLALDVYQDEGVMADSLRGQLVPDAPHHKAVLQLMDRNNVLLTPHNAFNTEEALDRKSQQSADAIEQFLNRKTFPCMVSEQ